MFANDNNTFSQYLANTVLAKVKYPLSLHMLHMAVCLPRFVIRQDVFLRLAVHNVDVVICQVDRFYPVTSGINHHRDASTCHAARDQHRHQAYG